MKRTGTHAFATAIGSMSISWTERGIHSTRLPPGKVSCTCGACLLGEVVADEQLVPALVWETVRRLRDHLDGSQDPLDDIPLDLGRLSPFSTRVLTALRRVRPGVVRARLRIVEIGRLGRASRREQFAGQL